MRELGCQSFHGYLLGRPMPLIEFERLLPTTTVKVESEGPMFLTTPSAKGETEHIVNILQIGVRTCSQIKTASIAPPCPSGERCVIYSGKAPCSPRPSLLLIGAHFFGERSMFYRIGRITDALDCVHYAWPDRAHHRHESAAFPGCRQLRRVRYRRTP